MTDTMSVAFNVEGPSNEPGFHEDGHGDLSVRHCDESAEDGAEGEESRGHVEEVTVIGWEEEDDGSGMCVADVAWCSIHTWYPLFKKYTVFSIP